MDAKHTYDELVAINAELVAALRTFLDSFEGPACCVALDSAGRNSMPGLLNAGEQARAAIAKATSASADA